MKKLIGEFIGMAGGLIIVVVVGYLFFWLIIRIIDILVDFLPLY